MISRAMQKTGSTNRLRALMARQAARTRSNVSMTMTKERRYPNRQKLFPNSIRRLINCLNPENLGGELELLARNSTQLKETNQRFLNQVVGTGRASGDSDDSRAR